MYLLLARLRSLTVLLFAILAGLTICAASLRAEAPRQTNSSGESRTAVFVANSTNHSAVPVRLASYRLRYQEIPAQANYVWRKTQNGWQQIPLDEKPLVHVLELPHQRPRIHPFSVASLTLLLTLAAIAWASSEWDWCRFVGEEW